MSTTKIIRFGSNPPKPEAGRPNNVIAGDPTTAVSNYFTDPSGSFSSGIWESTPGKWPIDYRESEFIYLIEGRVRLTDVDGHAETFEAGSAFVIPAGFKGSWETIEVVKKYYAIFERLG
jgi:uncharacterized cupin superfamily protein